MSPLAQRVYNALVENAQAWVAAGNPPLDPRDLSKSEQFVLMGGRLPSPQAAPAEPTAAAPIPDTTPAAPKPVTVFSRDYKPGEPIPFDEAMAVLSANRTPEEQDLADDVAARAVPAEIQTYEMWKPLRQNVG